MRFVPKSNPARVLIGQPSQHDMDIGLAVREGQDVAVNVFSGSSVLAPGTKTGDSEIIDRILSPLAQSEVGTIRCIGLNVSYSHSHLIVCCSRMVSDTDMSDVVQAARRRGQDGSAYHTECVLVRKTLRSSICRGSHLILDILGSRVHLLEIPGRRQLSSPN